MSRCIPSLVRYSAPRQLQPVSYLARNFTSTSSVASSSQLEHEVVEPETRSNGDDKTDKGAKRMTKAQKQMLERGQILAQSFKSGGQNEVAEQEDAEEETGASTSSPSSDGSKTDFLSLLKSAPLPTPDISPDLRVLLTCRPTQPPQPHHKTYEWKYNGHYEKLNRAFLRDQLATMYEELRVEEMRGQSAPSEEPEASTSASSSSTPPSEPYTSLTPPLYPMKRSAPKKEIIQSILSHWGWPPMRDVRKEKKERERKKKVIQLPVPLAPAENYFLRREPAFVRELATRNMLQLTLDSSAPLDASQPGSSAKRQTVLLVKGRTYDVEQFQAALQHKFDAMISRKFTREILRNEGEQGEMKGLGRLFETVSVMADAFVEETEGGNIKISYFVESNREKAIDLLRAAHKHLSSSSASKQVETFALASSSSTPDQPEEYALYPFIPPTAYVPSALSASGVVTKADIGSDWVLAGQSWFRLRKVGGWFSPREGENTSKVIALSQEGGSGELSLKDLVTDNDKDVVVTVEHGQVVLSSENAGNASWKPPIDGTASLSSIGMEMKQSGYSTVFLPSSSTTVGDAEALGRPPLRSRRVSYQAEQDGLEQFLKVEQEIDEESEGQTSIVAGSEQVRYCLRPEDLTDLRIRTRKLHKIEHDSLPENLKAFLADDAKIALPPPTIVIGKVAYTLQSALHVDRFTRQDNTSDHYYEQSTDMSTGIRGSQIAEIVSSAYNISCKQELTRNSPQQIKGKVINRLLG